MAPLTADAPLRFKGEVKTEKFILDTSGAQIIYKGCGIILDADVDTVNVHTAEGVTMVTGDVFIGIAAEAKQVAAGALERTEIEVMVWPTIVGFKNAVLTNVSLGKVVSMSDTATLSVAAAGAYPRIGKLFKVEDGYAYVQLDSPFVQTV
jgi:hypothetical protein